MELDGVMARIRREGCEIAKEEKERNGDVYREIKVGAIFEGKPGRNRSELVPGVFVDEAVPITYVARQITAEAFGYLFYQLAFSCGIEESDEMVVLGDGAVWIWKIAQEHFPHAVHIVDIWHAREHVWNVANEVYGFGKAETAFWAKQAREWLNEGAIERLLQEIEALPSVAPAAGASRSVPEIEADYFRTNAKRMQYPIFRAKGMHLEAELLKPLVKPLFLHVQNDQECVGPHKVLMQSLLCVLPCSTKPTRPSGNHVITLLLDCLQIFHTPPSRVRVTFSRGVSPPRMSNGGT